MADYKPPDYVPPPLPTGYTIPMQIVEAWFRIEPTAYVDVKLTRGDWDCLFTAIDKATSASVHTNSMMIHWTNGNLPASNASLTESQRALIEAENALRRFFNALMASAVQGQRR
jgi:hypothetical protein